MTATEERPLALVTGASTGIGLELARVFAENGFDLIVAADDDEVVRAGQELRAAGALVDAVQVDLATEAGVGELELHVLEAMMNGEEQVISHSLKTRAQGIASRVLPDRVDAKMHRRQAEPGSAQDS